ncbi:TspO/MBR family protein [Alsobacter sp. R-9]
MTAFDGTTGTGGRGRAIGHGVLAGILSVAASAIGGMVTRPHIPTWYAGLAKPWFNPPNWLFAPVWTILFAMMALAFWRVLQTPPSPARRAAIVAYLVQLALNVGWSASFFGLQSPGLGLGVIIPFAVMIAVTIALFARLDRPAAWLLAPYLAWVSFATVLNGWIWWANA